ncbi:uncharacterized protein LOC141837821 [Curcuma longa]|uniref:uncharacterized protein LOC141837821 n=1 Tax=Curcuma longa TaxID=136217 RepID=UPI003D9EB62A
MLIKAFVHLKRRIYPVVSPVFTLMRTTSAIVISSRIPASFAVEAVPTVPYTTGVEGRVDYDGDRGNGRRCRQVTESAERVCEIIITRPRWESSLLSRFSPSVLFHPTCVCQVLRLLSSKNPMLSLRYLLWLSSHPDAPPADPEASASLLFALADVRAWKAALLAIRTMKCQPDARALESFLLRLIVNERCGRDVMVEAIALVNTNLTYYSVPLSIWNTSLSSCLRSKRTDLVWRSYESMMQAGVAGDASTAGYLIQAFCIENKLDDAYRLLREVSMKGLIPDVISITKLIAEFSKDGNFGNVSELLHLMIAGGCMPDIFTYQSIIQGLCENGKVHDGFHIFNNLKLRGYDPDLVTYTTMIDGLCKTGKMVVAWNLWLEMIGKGLKPNAYAYNVIINGYCKARDLSRAQNLYNEMGSAGLSESIMSCNTMISGLCLEGRMEEALNMFEEMPNKGIEPDVITYNTLIQGFCNEGNTTEANKLYKKLFSMGLKPSVSTYTPLIWTLCKEGNVLDAVELIKCMKEKNLEPLVCTNDFVVDGFCEVGKVEEAMSWLVNMLENNLKPKKGTINKLLVCLTKNHIVDDALLVLNNLFKLGYSLDIHICYLLIDQLCRDTRTQSTLQVEEILLNK